MSWLIISLLIGFLSNLAKVIEIVLLLKLLAAICMFFFFVTEGWHYIRDRSHFSGGRLSANGRRIVAILSGLVSWAICGFGLRFIIIPLVLGSVGVYRENAEIVSCVKGEIRSVDRRFVSFYINKSSEAYWMIFGPFVRVGNVYKIVYLRDSKIVLSVTKINESHGKGKER